VTARRLARRWYLAAFVVLLAWAALSVALRRELPQLPAVMGVIFCAMRGSYWQGAAAAQRDAKAIVAAVLSGKGVRK
jgi:hypothetical protein